MIAEDYIRFTWPINEEYFVPDFQLYIVEYKDKLIEYKNSNANNNEVDFIIMEVGFYDRIARHSIVSSIRPPTNIERENANKILSFLHERLLFKNKGNNKIRNFAELENSFKWKEDKLSNQLIFITEHQKRIPKEYISYWQKEEQELLYKCNKESIDENLFGKSAEHKYDILQSYLLELKNDISAKWKLRIYNYIQEQRLFWGNSLNIISGTNYMSDILIQLYQNDLICSSFMKNFDELISNPDQVIYLDNLEFVESKLFLVLKKFADIGAIKITDYAGVNKKNKAIYNYIESHFRFHNYDEKRTKKE